MITNPLIEALSKTETKIGFRARHEHVEQDEKTAHANTFKLRIHSKTPFNDNWQVELELDHVQAYSTHHHSDAVLANDQLTIADPEGTELNEAFINFHHNDFQVRLGRQRIAFSDQRFIGSVDFRQNDQTFDALSLKTNLWTSSQLDYAYLRNVNRIFGDDAGSRLSSKDERFDTLEGKRPKALQGNHRLDAHLFNLSIKEWDHWEFNSYFYDVENQTFAAFSNQSLGIRAEYRKKVSHIEFFANTELALQKQQKTNSNKWIDYSLFEAGTKYRYLQFSLRQERLGEEQGLAFITPLATLHKFQGWADQFLTTPSTGLNDRSARLQWKQRPFIVDVRYHRFDSVKNPSHIGNETNLDLAYNINRKHKVKIRYADFRAKGHQELASESVRKIFFMYTYNL